MSADIAHWRLIWAASNSCADLLYATGFMASDPFLWVQTPNCQVIVVTPLEYGRAQKEAKPGIEVLSSQAAAQRWKLAPEAGGDPVKVISALATTLNQESWQVPADFPFGLAKRVQAEGVLLDPVAPFMPERRHKSAAEIEAVRAGVLLAEAGLAHAVALLRQSTVDETGCLVWGNQVLTAETLRGQIAAAIAGAGGSAANTIAAPGCQGADPHRVGTGPIRAHEPIVLDIFPRVEQTGYHGDLTRTVVKGKAAPVVERAYRAVQEAQRCAIAVAGPGVAVADVHAAAAAALQTAGFATDKDASPPRGFFHGTGHGLGLEVHEAPRVSSTSNAVLQPGDVITIEPGLYYPEWGGVRLEDVIAIGEHGVRNLTTAPFDFEL